jgi:tRNA modification GTPase
VIPNQPIAKHHKSSMSSDSLKLINDSIVALATSNGSGAIGIIRLSGVNCHQLLLPFLKKALKPYVITSESRRDSLELDDFPPRVMKFISLWDPSSKKTLDEGMVVFFKGTQSYTGEDSAELHVHGGTYNVQKILSALLSHGFRLADPGEFSKRAYLNGKIDLTTAEGIRSLIEAHSEQEWLAARQLASGSLANHIDLLRYKLIESLAFLEAQVDFPDEGDTAHLTLEAVDRHTRDVQLEIQRLLETFQSGFIASNGLKVVLIGEPNAGKSTLMNTLLQKERSLVTPIPGTTRDYLEEKCLINGRLIRLFDLAGIRKSEDPVESLGIQKALEIASRSDLALILIPCNESFDPQKYQILISELGLNNYFLVFTKIDLADSIFPSTDGLYISCHDGRGLDTLKSAIAGYVDQNIASLTNEAPFITDIRHFNSLESAQDALTRYFNARDVGDSIEILGAELRCATRDLHSIIGEVAVDDVLDHIFGKFCIGK